MQYFLEKLIKISLVFAAIVVVLMLTFILSSSHHHELPYKSTNIRVKYMDEEMKQFVSKGYTSDKKRLVLYAPEIFHSTCPYVKKFAAVVQKELANPRWAGVYDFYPQIRSYNGNTRSELNKQRELLVDFTENVCDDICIVDFNEGWAYSIKRTASVYDALEYFKNH